MRTTTESIVSRLRAGEHIHTKLGTAFAIPQVNAKDRYFVRVHGQGEADYANPEDAAARLGTDEWGEFLAFQLLDRRGITFGYQTDSGNVYLIGERMPPNPDHGVKLLALPNYDSQLDVYNARGHEHRDLTERELDTIRNHVRSHLNAIKS